MIAAMKRRRFITLLGGAAVAWPLAARAQQGKKIPRIGVLWPNPPATFDFLRQGLKDFGYVEGQNVAFEFRWAEGKLDLLNELAAELVRLQVDVIVTLAPQATLAAKQATQTIPIVFVAMGDPIASGVVPRRERDWHDPDDLRDERQACGTAQGGGSLAQQTGRSLESDEFLARPGATGRRSRCPIVVAPHSAIVSARSR